MKLLMKMPDVNRNGLLIALILILMGLMYGMNALWIPGICIAGLWVISPALPVTKMSQAIVFGCWIASILLNTLGAVLIQKNFTDQGVDTMLIIAHTLSIASFVYAVEVKRRNNDDLAWYQGMGIASGILMIATGFLNGWSMVLLFVLFAYFSIFNTLDIRYINRPAGMKE